MGKMGQRSPGDGGAGLRPGQVVAGRYRIHRLLGKGAMGEVYRADDLTLGRHVALKFPHLDGPGGALSQRLAAEVAVAQRVSHPNVCRVHELGRHGKRVFLSMEIIEGETLQAVLGRSVGTLRDDEKLRIAHDLCAALGAIHAKGVLFRDFKPGNIMLDSDGRALVTDFGLAACGVVTDPGSGTVEYMAPEQHVGGEPSIQSDLYGLGLVLYEVFAGRPAFSPRDRKKLAARKLEGPPDFPADGEPAAQVEAEVGGQVSPQVREVILRCLAPGPEDRPASADEVAAALPERPSRGTDHGCSWIVPPETLLVAPRWVSRGWSLHALFASVLLALLAVAALGPASQATRTAERGDPPKALEVRARQVVSAAHLKREGGEEHSGYADEPRGFARAARSAGATAVVPPVLFWYRWCPRRVLTQAAGNAFRRYDGPPFTEPGMVGVQLSPGGDLVRLDVVPPRWTPPGAPTRAPDWGPLFAAAGLDFERFQPVAPIWTPPAFADLRQAWQGPGPEWAGATVRVEVASFAGMPVSFRLLEPRMVAPAEEAGGEDVVPPIVGVEMQVASSRAGRAVAGLWFVGVLAGTVLLARRNLFRRVADRPAAFRLALAVLLVRSASWLLGARHLPGPAELLLLTPHLARALLAAAQVWVIYLALEPFVRRFWPDLTASWVRITYGRLSDPLVGYHLLIGSLFGAAVVLASRLYATLAGTLGLAPPRLDALGTLTYQVQLRGLDLQCEALRGLRQALAMETLAVLHGVLVSLFAVVGVVLLRLLLKKPWLSRTAALALFVTLLFPAAGDPVADLVMTVLVCALWIVALLRFGFLAAATATATAWLLSSHPLTLDPSAWYAPGSAVALLAVACVALHGFKTSLAGQSVLPPQWLQLDEPSPAEAP